MPLNIVFRSAAPADAYALAELAILGGDGIYEFLLEEFAPREMLAGLMARTMKHDSGGFCWQHCFVATQQDAIVGMINAFPAAWLRDEERDVLPQDRVQVLEPIDQAQDWQSFLVNSIAVRAPYRQQGIGSKLIAWAVEQARTAGFGRMSASVWKDNAAAYALFAKSNFEVNTTIDVPQHAALPHAGGSLLMVRKIDLSG
jgi:GNAT superfamily N-acetyltransferase